MWVVSGPGRWRVTWVWAFLGCRRRQKIEKYGEGEEEGGEELFGVWSHVERRGRGRGRGMRAILALEEIKGLSGVGEIMTKCLYF